MHGSRRALAIAELALLVPAAIFMIALVMRGLVPLEYEPAQTAQEIIAWYSMRAWTLWILLIALPLSVLVTGCVALGNRGERGRSQTAAATRSRPTTYVIAAASAAAGATLVVVALHMLAN